MTSYTIYYIECETNWDHSWFRDSTNYDTLEEAMSDFEKIKTAQPVWSTGKTRLVKQEVKFSTVQSYDSNL